MAEIKKKNQDLEASVAYYKKIVEFHVEQR